MPLQWLSQLELEFVCGVPCSRLGKLINWAAHATQTVAAVNEGDAVAVCAGLALAGRNAAYYCQNSGLGNAVSPLTSLVQTFGIPTLGFVSVRGYPDGPADEPQHKLMGQITISLLESMGLEWSYWPRDAREQADTVARVRRARAERRSYVVVVVDQSLNASYPSAHTLAAARSRTQGAESITPIESITRKQVLQTIVQHASAANAAVVSSTGYVSRALAYTADRDNHFYMVGSMGCAISIALGVAVGRPQRRVVAVDGDGALLMRMGAAAAAAAQGAGNLTHVLLDNGVHESTGGQPTGASAVDFPAWARAVGYGSVQTVHHSHELDAVITSAVSCPTTSFVYVRTLQESAAAAARPSMHPRDVAARFRAHLSAER